MDFSEQRQTPYQNGQSAKGRTKQEEWTKSQSE
jgi:hypothetical protein